LARPGATVPAFESATSKDMCAGAILRAKISNPQNTIEPVAWGFRNPYGIRFSPADHPLKGEMMITENGEDERGAAADQQLARPAGDRTPEPERLTGMAWLAGPLRLPRFDAIGVQSQGQRRGRQPVADER
jgi:hypothetical protein